MPDSKSAGYLALQTYTSRLQKTLLKEVYVDKEHSNTKHESLEKLELLWAKIESDFKPFNREVSVADNPISAFTYYLEMGKYPPPEIMVEIMAGFLEYFNSHGDKSLDEAFFEAKHKKYGSLSYKQDYSLRYSAFEWFIFKGDFTSLDDAAEEFLKPIAEEIDQDTFLRNYRRWKSKKN